MTEERPHIGTKRLIAYRQGTLPAAEREAVQEHLSLCPRCTGLLRELREFEAVMAEGDSPETDPLREEAWASFVQRLPPKPPALRPVAGPDQPEGPKRSAPPRLRPVYVAAAALVLAAVGLATWESASVRQLERRLAQREEALASVQRSEQETRHQLDSARARIQDLEARQAPDPVRAQREAELAARVAELSSEVEALRRAAGPQPDRIAAASGVEVSLAPRFVLRGEEAPGGEVLRSGGAANPVKAEAGRVSVALDLAGLSASPGIRFELVDRAGRVLWSGRRPGDALAGDDGTLVVIQGLAPGRYRLRVEGGAHRAEYLLDVQPQSP